MGHAIKTVIVDPETMQKRCPGCDTTKPLHVFGKNRSRSDGLNTYCQECCTSRRLIKRPPKRAKRPQDVAAGSKWCTKCKAVKPNELFGHDNSRQDGLQPACRACHAAYYEARKPPQVEKPLIRPPVEKRCTKCGSVKLLADFNRHGSRPGYLAPSCRACQASRLANWRLANPEKVKVGQEDHYERHRAERIARVKVWSESNPEKRSDIAFKNSYIRRARIAKQLPLFDGTRLAELIARDGLHCYLCGELTALDVPRQHPKKTVRDHYMPIRLGGTHTADNLRIACWQCNNWKSGRHPDKAKALIARRIAAKRLASQKSDKNGPEAQGIE